jgi:flavin reductase (DIM6/NTAB) family NADH-FMN oxidoreductase RutF
MPISADKLRHAMRAWASGVTVVSAEYDGVHHGMTVSSFTSLSLTPPLVMVSLERQTRTHDLVQGAKTFGVTILAEDQMDVSNRFASPGTESEYRFQGIEIRRMETGAPLLDRGMAFFDCRVVTSYDAGTHTVFVGEVVAAELGEDQPPLVYFNQNYRKIDG